MSTSVGCLSKVMENPQTSATRHLIPSVSRSDSAEQSQQPLHCDTVSPDPCVCSSTATSPQDSAITLSVLGNASFMLSNPGSCLNNGARSTASLPVSWCGAFRDPPGLEHSKPGSDSDVPSSLLTRKVLKVRRLASRHEKSSVWSSGASGQAFVTIPKPGPERAVALAQTVTPSKTVRVLGDELRKSSPLRDINAEAEGERRTRRHHVRIDHLIGRGPKADQTLLELRSVYTPATRKSHEVAVRRFLMFCQRPEHHLHTDADIDRALVCDANVMYVAGLQHYHGKNLLPPSWIAGWLSAKQDDGKFLDIPGL